MKLDTLCVHHEDSNCDLSGAVCTPIYQTATFAHNKTASGLEYDYSRVQNPTREILEKTLARLENAHASLAFTTGMAALACFMELFEPGDEIIVSDDLYGGSVRLFNLISQKNSLKIIYVDTSNISMIENSLNKKTKAIFIETPTNPMMKISDIKAVKALIARRDIILAVDNTFLTPYFQQPLSLGADVVMHSATKYIGGHNDTLAGFLVVKSPELTERLRTIYKTTGSCLAPLDSFLILRGLKTLALRMEKSQENAKQIANYLLKKPEVKNVYYPGLVSHPGHEILLKQSSGFGAMLSLKVHSKEIAEKLLQKVRLIIYAESLGGVETLITYPILQTHADVPENKRKALGIDDKLLRISVGIENITDLLEDLEQAFA